MAGDLAAVDLADEVCGCVFQGRVQKQGLADDPAQSVKDAIRLSDDVKGCI